MTSPEVLERTVYTDPVTRFVRSLPGDYFMLREAAHACEVSQFTLRKFIAEDVKECLPSKTTKFGKIRVYLYTREDIARRDSVSPSAAPFEQSRPRLAG